MRAGARLPTSAPAPATISMSSRPSHSQRPATLFGSRSGLLLGFGLMLLLMGFIIAIGLHRMDTIQRRLDVIVNNHMAKITLTTRMRIAARERTVNLQHMILLADPFDRDAQWMQFNKHATEFARARIALLDMALTPREREILAQQSLFTGRTVPLQNEVVDLAMAGRMREAHRLLIEEAIPAQDLVFRELRALENVQRRAAAVAVREAKEAYRSARYWLIVLSGSALALGLFVAVVVTRRSRKAEAVLYKEKERAQVTLHSIGDGVITTDANGWIEYMNPAAERLTGWRNHKARGRSILDVFKIYRESKQVPADNPLDEVIAKGRVVSNVSDIVLKAKTGREYLVELTASPIHDEMYELVGTVLVFRDVTELRALNKELRYRASHDALTGLLNRAEFERQLQQALDGARTSNSHHALCYIDLDLFKVVNDTCGHTAGDELLKQISLILKREIRQSDVLARLGGDEFGILLEGCALSRAQTIADHIRKNIQDFRFVWEEKSFQIGASIGVVEVNADSGAVIDVFRMADVACYAAKEGGRNRVHVFHPDDSVMAERQGEIDWVQRINNALKWERIVLYGQRMERFGKGSGYQYEILIRIRENDDQLVSPDRFLPAAERYHLMPVVDRWVIAKAFSMISALVGGHHDDIEGFSLNISGQSLNDPALLPFIVEEMKRNKVPPEWLCFEITETTAVTHFSSALRLISELKGMGCRFSLDDFGSGLSSFGYLKNLPVDFVKVDGAFVRDILNDKADLAMVRSIHEVARAMEIGTIAEYVENEAIYQVLEKIGIDYGQGNYIARPEPLSEVTARMQAEFAAGSLASGTR